MRNNILEYIILYVMVTCTALVIATLTRIFAASLGFDSFTTFMVFIIVLAILMVVYLSIHVVLQNLMLPWIGKWLSKMPYFRKKMERKQVSIIEEETTEEAIAVEEKAEMEEEKLLNTPKQASLEDIRNEQRHNIAKEQEEKQNITLDYTRKSFALYLSDEHLDLLCRNVLIYINNQDTDGLHPVKVKELTALDLRHFGWNIWNFFKPRNQIDITNFLKTSFPDIFKETEVDSIKRHLKDDELKGVIKIEENIKQEGMSFNTPS